MARRALRTPIDHCIRVRLPCRALALRGRDGVRLHARSRRQAALTPRPLFPLQSVLAALKSDADPNDYPRSVRALSSATQAPPCEVYRALLDTAVRRASPRLVL